MMNRRGDYAGFSIFGSGMSAWMGNPAVDSLFEPEQRPRANRNQSPEPTANKAVCYPTSLVWVCGSFFVGTLTITWITYLLSCLFHRADSPMAWEMRLP
jgi:hypothetical protein